MANPAFRPDSHVCLRCGASMAEVGCKLRCRTCGYFLEDCGNGLTPTPISMAAVTS